MECNLDTVPRDFHFLDKYHFGKQTKILFAFLKKIKKLCCVDFWRETGANIYSPQIGHHQQTKEKSCLVTNEFIGISNRCVGD